ncbi:MAG: MFS transporter [Propionibacteriales bacterium]|nr:MFS transporter [Propionibacteriales bacterium]
MRREAGWLYLLLGGTVLVQAAVFAGRPMTTYRALELGASTTVVGLIVASFAVVPLVLAVPAGRGVDGNRARAFLRYGAGLSLLGAVALAAAPSLLLLALGNAVAGVGLLLSAIAAQGIIARRAPSEDHDRAFGLFTVAASVGQLIGPVLSGAAASHLPGGPRAGLAAASLLAVLLLVVSLAYRQSERAASREPGTDPAPGTDGNPARLLGMIRTRGMSPAMLASLSLLTCVDLITAFLPVLAQERGISPATVGWLLALRAFASIVSRLMVARLAARWGRRWVLVGSMVVAAVALVLFTLGSATAVLVALMLVAGFALGLGQPLTMSWVVGLVPERSRATALALRLGANRAGQVAVPAAAGVVAGLGGAAGVFVLTGVMLTGAATGVLLSRAGSGSPGGG